jgi:hypothetical protein
MAMTAQMALWIAASLFAPPLDICFRFRTFHLKTMCYVQNLNKKSRLFFCIIFISKLNYIPKKYIGWNVKSLSNFLETDTLIVCAMKLV